MKSVSDKRRELPPLRSVWQRSGTPKAILVHIVRSSTNEVGRGHAKQCKQHRTPGGACKIFDGAVRAGVPSLAASALCCRGTTEAAATRRGIPRCADVLGVTPPHLPAARGGR